MIRKLIFILLAFVGMFLFSEDTSAQQSTNNFNFEVEEVENSERSKLILDRFFKKSQFDEIEIDGKTQDLYSDINGNWTDQNGIEYI